MCDDSGESLADKNSRAIVLMLTHTRKWSAGGPPARGGAGSLSDMACEQVTALKTCKQAEEQRHMLHIMTSVRCMNQLDWLAAARSTCVLSTLIMYQFCPDLPCQAERVMAAA
jgi:hypothetical protein